MFIQQYLLRMYIQVYYSFVQYDDLIWRNSMQIASWQMAGPVLLTTEFNTLDRHLQS